MSAAFTVPRTITGAHTFSTAPTFSNGVTIDGGIEHLGAQVGFFGTTPTTQAPLVADYGPSDISGSGSVDPDVVASNLQGIATAVNAIIDTLQRHGLMGAS